MNLFAPYTLEGPGLWQGFMEQFAVRELECVQVEVTSHCPGHCGYCPHTTDAGDWRSRHMSAEVFAGLWPLLRRTARVHLQGWGEPLLHPHFFEFAALALRAGCRVSTTTCGLRMDEPLAERLVDSGLDIIAFSLTGTDETSNAARAGVPFSRVAEAVTTLQRVRKTRMGVHLEVHLAYLLLASQMEALVRLPELMDQWDVHGAVISTMDYVADASLTAEAFLPHEHNKIAAAREVILGVLSRTDRAVHASLPDPFPAPQCRERVQKTVYVSAEGEISPCVYLNVPSGRAARRRIFGRVPGNDPVAVWNMDGFQEFRVRVGTDEPDGVCLGCPKRFEQSIARS